MAKFGGRTSEGYDRVSREIMRLVRDAKNKSQSDEIVPFQPHVETEID
jgi:hypothetical protein